MRLLVEAGADVNRRDRSQRVPLSHVAEAATAKALLAAGAEMNAPDDLGVSPLHAALERGELDLLRVMVDYGGDLAQPLPDGTAPVDAAKEAGHKEVVALIESKTLKKQTSRRARSKKKDALGL